MTRSTISEDNIPFALFALERMMFIRAFEKARWDLSAGGTAGDHRFDSSLRRPGGRAGGRMCRLVGSGQGHRDLPRPRIGSRGGPFACSSRRDLRSTIRASTVGGLSREVRVGQVFINGYGAGGGIELPFGGMKKSGHGRGEGVEALYELAAMKTLVVKHG
jgi:hypothetical protein